MVQSIACKHNNILIASDTHNNLEEIKQLAQLAKETPTDAIALIGDIPGYTVASFVKILKAAKKANVPVMVFAGSHENNEVYTKTLAKFKDDKLIIDGMQYKNMLLHYGEWELVLIPGSNVVSSAPTAYKGGSFYLTQKKPTKKEQAANDERLRSKKISKTVTFIVIDEIQKQLDTYSKVAASRKLALAHIPLLQKTTKGIDRAQFYVATEDFTVSKKHVKAINKLESEEKNINKGSIMSQREAEELAKLKYPVKLMKKNVGSKLINTFLDKNKINKFICGHIHEAGMRAVDKNERKVKENTPVSEALINSGEHVATRLTFHDKGKISYEFLKL